MAAEDRQIELTNAEGHCALKYVGALDRQGYTLTVEELEAYITRPTRRGSTARRGVPAWRLGISSILDQMMVDDPGRPGETVTAWLTRLRWLHQDHEKVRITALGTAVLAHLEEESLEADIPVALVLDQDDPLATARVFGRMGELGPCALVDPYFSYELLPHLMKATHIERVLTSPRDPKELEVLRLALAGSLAGFEPDTSPDIRMSDAFHDRFVIPETGPIWLLGTSLTGIGKRLSLMVEVEDETVSHAVRQRFDKEWSHATHVRDEGLGEDGSEEPEK